MTKFHQNWFKHFVETLDNVVDRKKLKNLRETEHRRIACACVKKEETSEKQDPAGVTGRVRKKKKKEETSN